MLQAREHELDLVEINPNETPPVVKVMGFGKYLYKQQKQVQNQKKSANRTVTKEIRFSFNTEKHDLDFKIKQGRGFLEKGHYLKINLVMRGREAMHHNLAVEKVRYALEQLSDIATSEKGAETQNNQIVALLTPKK